MVEFGSLVCLWCSGNHVEGVGMTNPETSWIEQEAIERWWNKHKFELKQSVTTERVRLQEENEELKKEIKFARTVIQQCTPNTYVRAQAENEVLKEKLAEAQEALDAAAVGLAEVGKENLQLKKQIAQLQREKVMLQ